MLTGPVIDHMVSLKVMYEGLIPKSWSANFEEEPYFDRPDMIIAEALMAIEATHPVDENHYAFVNLVTPAELGDPSGYLIPALTQAMGETIKFEEAGQCGCGGFVLRVWRLS